MTEPILLHGSKGSMPRDGGPSFSLTNRVVRLVWGITWRVFASWTPRPLHPWRRFLLRSFGASLGAGADVRGSARVWLPSNLVMGAGAVIGPNVNCYNQALITIEERALISQGAHLCSGTHDIEDEHFQLVAVPIRIGAHAWVAAEAFVGPGAVVGVGAVVGARGVAFGHFEPWAVFAGNPAKKIRERRWRPTA